LRNIDKRLEALKYLTDNLNFIIYTLVIDKEKLYKEKGGLRFKEVFYKYFQKIFLSQINNNFFDFEIHMDNLINEKYEIELKKYVTENYQNSFFEKYNISDDKEQPLIQLADLLAGSLGRVFNSSFQSERSEELFFLLKPKLAKISFFPLKEYDERLQIGANELYVDEEISNIVRGDAENISENEDDMIIKCLLDYLLWNQKVLPYNYTQTYEILSNIKHSTGKDVSV